MRALLALPALSIGCGSSGRNGQQRRASNGAFHLAELAAMAGNDGGVASAAAAMARSELAAAAAVASPRSQAARSHLNTVAAQLRLSDMQARPGTNLLEKS